MASAGTPREVPNPARRPNVGGGWHTTGRGDVGRVLCLEDLAGPCLVQSSGAFDDNGETILDPTTERIGAPIFQALHTDHGHRLSVRFLMADTLLEDLTGRGSVDKSNNGEKSL